MSAHTPGPWELRLEKDGRVEGIYTTRPSPEDVEISGEFAGKIVETDGGIYPPKLPDARLIAAAPDLLEACQTFAEWLRREETGFDHKTHNRETPEGEAAACEWFYGNIEICGLAQKQARAAIAKATGEESGN